MEMDTDFSVINVAQKIVEMGEIRAHIYCLFFFLLISIVFLYECKYLSYKDLFQCDTIRQTAF